MKITESDVLRETLEYFHKKSFIKFRAQRFPSYSLLNTNKKDGIDFKKTMNMVSVSYVPHNSNVTYYDVLYNVKVNDDHTFKVKVGIAPNGNEENKKG